MIDHFRVTSARKNDALVCRLFMARALSFPAEAGSLHGVWKYYDCRLILLEEGEVSCKLPALLNSSFTVVGLHFPDTMQIS
jgi:hypothetical protein